MKTWSNGVALGLAVLAILLSIWILLKPADGPEAAKTGGLKSDRTLRVGVVPAPPASLFDAGSGKASGHSVDMMNAVASRSDLRVTYLAGNWATVGSALSSGQIDVVIGPVFMTEGRAMEYLFTKPLYEFAVVPVVAEGSSLASLEDLRRDGIRAAVGRGGFDADFVAKFLPRARVSEFPPDDPNLAMLEVKAGRADLAVVDYGTAKQFAAQNRGVKVLDQVILSRQYAGFMLRPNDQHLKEFLDVGLRNLMISGEIEAINQKYAESKIWYGQPEIR